MKVGFTGTRRGMTEAQKEAVRGLLAPWDVKEVHHGDCVGADSDFHDIASILLPRPLRIVHPPKDEDLRAFCGGDVFREPLTHFARNRAIVGETDCLVATPYEPERQTYGGTWMTFDYAVKRGKPVFLILPDGTVRLCNGPREIAEK